jgi:hypothetical protein
MATIVTRAGKGSPLTNAEVDANFTNINTELGTKANSSALASYLPLTGGIVGGQLEASDLLVKYNSATSWTTRLAAPWDQPAEVLNMNESGFSALTFHVANKYANLFGYDESNVLKTNNDTIWHSGNLTPSNYLLRSGGTMTGDIYMGSNWIHMSYSGGDSLRMNSYGAGFDFFNQSQGTWADIRARNAAFEIVYDRIDTSYYLDPNSTSRLNAASANVYTRPAAGTGYLSGAYGEGAESNSTTGPIYCISTGYGPTSTTLSNMYGIGYADGATSGVWASGGWGMYVAADGDARVFLDGSAGIVNATGSARAPIFYDSNNTAYYVDPDTNSIMSAIYARGQVRATGWWDAYGASATGLGIEIGQSGGRGFILSYNRNATTYGPMSFEANDFAFTGVSGGYAQINTSFRAPIFYDSGNTAYYLDPLSTSVLNNVRASTIEFTNGFTAINLTNSTYNMLNDPTGRVAIYLGGGADANSYYDNTTHNFRNRDAGLYSYITSGGIWAAAFTDFNNTAYYVDPAGSSNINGLTAGIITARSSNDAQLYLNGDGTSWAGISFTDVSNSDYLFYYGSTSTFSIGGGGAAAANKKLHINGGVTIGSSLGSSGVAANGLYVQTEVSAPIFYDSDNGAYYVDPSSNSVLNKLFLRNSSGVQAKAAETSSFGYSSGYRAVVLGNEYLTTISLGYDPINNASGVFNGGGEGREVLFRNGVNFITPNSANDSYLSPLTLADGYSASSGSFRAPVFYDSNNTNFYVDPQGGSFLGGQVAFSGGSYVATNGDFYARRDSATTGVYYFADGGSKYLYWSGGSYIFGSAGGVYTSVGMYSPIYYDNDNTSYYIDAASTSVLNTLMVATGVGAYDSNNDPYGKISVTRNTDANYSYYGLTRAGQLGMGMGIDTSNNFWIGTTSAGYNGTRNASWFSINNSGQVAALGDFRAPLFYDSNNTNYYLDPNSGSRLNGVTVDNLYSYGAIVAASSLTVGDGATASYIYMADSDEGTRTIHCNSNRIGFLSQAGGWGSWCDDDGAWRTDHAMWAPIFYDSNNSGYYVDANNNTNLYSLTLSGGTYFQPNSWIQFNGQYGLYWPNNNGAHIEANVSSSYGQLGLRGSRNNYSGIYDQFSGVNGMMYDGAGNGGVYREANGRWYFYHNVANNCTGFGSSTTASGYDIYAATGIYSGGRVDGTIFYDSNNTAYYTDPNGTSRINLINADTLRSYSNIYTDANYGFGLVGVYSASRYQGVFAMGDSYKLAADGTTTGSLYGIAWSHPNAGGVASNLNTHGALIMENGTFLAALSGSIRCRDDMRAPLFYDRDNSAYYTDPAGTSVLATVNFGSNPTAANGGGRIVPSVGSPYSIRQEFGSDNSGWRYGIAKNVGGTVTVLFYVQDSGDCVATGNLTAYSDIRVKDNVETVDNALHKLAAIRGVTYTRTDLDDKERRYAGVIAQELEQVLPEAVGGDEHTKTVDYNATIALLIQAVKELKAKVETLEAQSCH